MAAEALLYAVENQRNSIAHIVPDFVIEVRSKTDSLTSLKKKMTEAWMANGVRVAWLIDPLRKTAWVDRAGNAEPEETQGFEQILSGEGGLPGFEFDLKEIL